MSTVAQWVRFALTGNPDGATPSDPTITMLQAGAQQDLILRFPDCLTGDVLTGANFTEALGYAIAGKIVVMPSGQQYVRHVLSLKQGTVTKTYSSETTTQTDAQAILLDASSTALARIGCVRDALADVAASAPGLVSLSGRRRSLGCSCGGY